MSEIPGQMPPVFPLITLPKSILRLLQIPFNRLFFRLEANTGKAETLATVVLLQSTGIEQS